MLNKPWMLTVPGALMLCAAPAWAVDLRDAVQSALASNPEIRQAVSNRGATEEELQQGKGRYYPVISVQGSAGVEDLHNPTRKQLGIADHTLWPVEGDIIADELVYDSGGREAEIRRQAARSDAAAARVQERSEYVALNTSRTYIDYVLQQRLVAIAQDNVTFHEKLAGDLREGVAKGSISIADQQQAEERLQAARAKVTQAQEDLDTAAITFRTYTGMPIDTVSMPPDLAQCMPGSLDEAEGAARQENPRIREAMADLATSREEVRAAKAELGPTFSIQGRARAGHDIDGFEGKTTDLQALGVIKWTVFNGGIKEANVREQQQRESEVHGRLFERTRAAEEDVRTAWSRLQNQTALASELETQGRISDDLLLSYREQFNIGRRSLLGCARRAELALCRSGSDRDGAPGQALRAISGARVREPPDPVPRRSGAGCGDPERDGALPRQSDPAGGSAREQHSGAASGTCVCALGRNVRRRPPAPEGAMPPPPPPPPAVSPQGQRGDGGR